MSTSSKTARRGTGRRCPEHAGFSGVKVEGPFEGPFGVNTTVVELYCPVEQS